MNKILTIVVPYYNESAEEIFPLLSSINNQVGIDFSCLEVVLVNDGSKNIYTKEFIAVFHNLDIHIIYRDKNGGPGLARQSGLDCAGGKYIMFCDADDVIHNVGVLADILHELEESEPQIIDTPWVEEIWDGDRKQYFYLVHEDETTWMHGKVFNLVFLRDNNIRFHEELKIHEDSYFLCIAYSLANSRIKVSTKSYVWKWRKDSITRKNSEEYKYNSMPVFNQSVAESFKELKRRGEMESLVYRTVQIAVYIYFCLHRQQWLDENVKAQRKETEESFVKYFLPFIDYFYDADKEFISQVYNQERIKYFINEIEEETLFMWLDRIGYKKDDFKGENQHGR